MRGDRGQTVFGGWGHVALVVIVVVTAVVRVATWAVRHFSQANPVRSRQGDVPALLRRVADSIEELGRIEVQDLVLHQEITEDGPSFSVTVYFHHDEPGYR